MPTVPSACEHVRLQAGADFPMNIHGDGHVHKGRIRRRNTRRAVNEDDVRALGEAVRAESAGQG